MLPSTESPLVLVLVLVLGACATPQSPTPIRPERTTQLSVVTPPPTHRPPVPPPPSDVHATELATVELLTAQRAGVYVVTAYVLSSMGCAPCKGPDPCSPCGPPGVSVVAAPRVESQPARGPVVLLETLGFDAYERNARYRFTVRVTPREEQRMAPWLELLGAELLP